MPILDFSLPSSTQLLMGDGTPLNLLPALDGFRVEQPLVDPGLDQPLIWTGQITLAEVVGFPESLDKVANYSRWQRGKHPIRLYLHGTLIATLRIKSYTYDPEAGIAQLDVTDKLGLLDFDRSESSTSDFLNTAFTRSRPKAGGLTTTIRFASRGQTIRKTLVKGSTLNGVQYLQDSDIIIADLPEYLANSFDGNGNQQQDGFTTEQGEGKTNPVKVAQQMAGAIGYYVWMDAQERVRFTPYPVSSTTPIRRYSRAEVEEFKPKESEDPDLEAAATVEVVGRFQVSCKTLNPNDPEDKALLPPGFGTTYPQVQYVKGYNGVTIQQITRNATFGNTTANWQITTSARLDSIPGLRDAYSNNGGFITQEALTSSESYNSQGYLLTRLVSTQEPMGVIAPDVYPGVTAPATGSLLTETWTYDGDTPTRHEIYIQKPAYAVFSDKAAGSALVFAEGFLEEWIPLAAEKFQHYQYKTKPKGLLTTTTNPFDTTPSTAETPVSEIVDAPPSPPTIPADEPRVPQIAKDSVDIGADGEAPYAGKKLTFEVDFCPRGAVKPVAAMLAQLSWQRREPWLITRPFDPRCDLTFQPFQREDVHNKALIRDGFTLVIGDDGLSVSYTGNHLGDISTIPVPYEAPPLPASPTLAIAPIADLTFTVNVPISPIQLVAAGGTSPYSFGATGLPTGLSLSSGVISGTPAATGTFSVTVTVTDALSATASDGAAFTVNTIPAPTQYWQQTARIADGSYDREALNSNTEDTVDVSDGSYNREAATVYTGVVLYQEEWQECWMSGKVPVCVSRGLQQYRSSTTPTPSGSDYIFTLCDGSTTTLSPMMGGNLSAIPNTRTIVGACP